MEIEFVCDNAELAEKLAAQYALRAKDRVCIVEAGSLYACSLIISDFMLGMRMEYRLRRLIEKRMPELAAEDKEGLYCRSMEMLNSESIGWGIFAGKGRYMRMRQSVEGCIAQQPRLDAAGFESFRMRGLNEYLCAVMSVGVQELMFIDEEKEYFALLQGFMSGRRSGYATIRLNLRANGNYFLEGKSDYGMMGLEGGRVEGFCDMIISGLLMLAPQRLEIKQERELPQHRLLLKDLQRIFGSRMILLG